MIEFKVKRFLFLVLLIFIFITVESINMTCLFLDNILFPAWRKTVIKAPVFIIGMPRTASSRLQSILCEDNDFLLQEQLKPYRSTHIYAAEKYSLNAGEIRARYNNIYQEYLKN